MHVFYIVLLIIVAVLAVIFAIQNSAAVVVTFFGLTANASMSLILVITLAVGIIIGMILLLPTLIRQKHTISAQKKKEKEIAKQTPQPPTPEVHIVQPSNDSSENSESW